MIDKRDREPEAYCQCGDGLTQKLCGYCRSKSSIAPVAAPAAVNYLQAIRGVCFAHGPYEGGLCPKHPACGTDPQIYKPIPDAHAGTDEDAREWANQQDEDLRKLAKQLNGGQFENVLTHIVLPLLERNREVYAAPFKARTAALEGKVEQLEQQSAITETAFHEVLADFHHDDSTFQEVKQKYLDGAKAEIEMLNEILPIVIADIPRYVKSKELARAEAAEARISELTSSPREFAWQKLALSDLTLDALIEWVASTAHGNGDWGELRSEINRRFAELTSPEKARETRLNRNETVVPNLFYTKCELCHEATYYRNDQLGPKFCSSCAAAIISSKLQHGGK